MQLGIDEVGRGSLAGPLVIGAVCLDTPLPGLKDSKLLTIIERQRLAKLIYAKSNVTSLGWVWPHEIDEYGLTKATTLAIKRALAQITPIITSIIIDGSYNYLPDSEIVKTMIKADQLVPSVSAASIIAKVARDNYMRNLSKYFPNYDFGSHVGYGTKVHMLAIKQYGPCVLHRRSFAPLTMI